MRFIAWLAALVQLSNTLLNAAMIAKLLHDNKKD